MRDTDRRAIVTRILAVGPWPVLALALPPTTVLLALMDVGDLAYLVRAGDLMLDARSVLRHDVFTFTMAGEPWLNQQWGASIVLAALHRIGDWEGLVLIRAALVATLVAVTFARTRRAGASPTVASALVLGAFVVVVVVPGSLSLRPQLLAAVLFVVTLVVVDHRQERPALLITLVPLGAIWANLHGSFPLLTVILALACLQDGLARRGTSLRRTAVFAAISVALPLLTPWGTSTYAYLVDISTTPVIRQVVDEWRPLWFHPIASAAFALFAVTVGAIAIRSGGRPTLVDALAIGVFSALAIWSARNVLWWFLAVVPLLGAIVRSWDVRSQIAPAMTRVIAVAAGALLVLAVLRVATAGSGTELLHDAPVGVATALSEVTEPGDRVFDARWGSWFEYAVPDVRMFVDSRAELFDQRIWDQYFAVVDAAPGWQTVLESWDVAVVVASVERDPELIDALEVASGWTLAYEDAVGAVFVRGT